MTSNLGPTPRDFTLQEVQNALGTSYTVHSLEKNVVGDAFIKVKFHGKSYDVAVGKNVVAGFQNNNVPFIHQLSALIQAMDSDGTILTASTDQVKNELLFNSVRIPVDQDNENFLKEFEQKKAEATQSKKTIDEQLAQLDQVIIEKKATVKSLTPKWFMFNEDSPSLKEAQTELDEAIKRKDNFQKEQQKVLERLQEEIKELQKQESIHKAALLFKRHLSPPPNAIVAVSPTSNNP